MTVDPIKLEDLDRDELLHLVREAAGWLNPPDFAWARYSVAHGRAQAVYQAIIEMGERASVLLDQAHAATNRVKAAELTAEYYKLCADRERLTAKADRLQAKADRYRRALQELRDAAV